VTDADEPTPQQRQDAWAARQDAIARAVDAMPDAARAFALAHLDAVALVDRLLGRAGLYTLSFAEGLALAAAAISSAASDPPRR
jgi:hypothetical protein